MESLDSNMAGESSFLTGEIRSYLAETARWGRFLAIMGYIGIGIILLMAIMVMGMGSVASLVPGMGMGGLGIGAFGFIYVVIAAFYFFPVYYLHQFAIRIRRGLASQGLEDVTAGFQNLKSLFKFMGIFTIVILSIYALIIVIAIIAGVAAATR
jgi:hypothetical protein